jgi:hypothetical protein
MWLGWAARVGYAAYGLVYIAVGAIAANRPHGFVLRDGSYTPIDFPGATATRAFGINARGDIVGNYVLGGKTYGYVARR